MWEITTVLLLVVVTLLWLFYRKRTGQMEVFKEMGIPGPTPHWIYGNYKLLERKNIFEVLKDWKKQYGETYGYYEGPVPILVTSNLDIIKQVFVKNFSHFHGRKEFSMQPSKDSEVAHMVLASGKRWKRLRTISNPTFSSSKLKLMFPLMVNKVNILVERMQEAAHNDKAVDVHPYYQAVTLDVIGEAGFGMDVNSQRNPDDFVYKAATKVFDIMNRDEKPFFMVIAELLPEVKSIVFAMFMLMMKIMKIPTAVVMAEMEKVIKQRKEHPENKRMDLLQLMLDAEVEAVPMEQSDRWIMKAEEDATETHQIQDKPKEKTSAKIEKKLTIQEIAAQSFLFLTAGYETTSAALAFATYLLATNPDKQQKLLDELDEHLPDVKEASYDDIQKLSYLHMVMCETLRLYPIGSSVVTRLCMEPCTVEGINFPKGMVVQPNVWDIHYNSDTWGPDPELFVPERFNKDEHSARHSMAWLPFGGGPRNCLGLRFALLEAKLALVSILQKCRFEECDDTQATLKLQEKLIVGPKDGITVKVVAR